MADPDNRDAENAFGSELPPSGADAFGSSGFASPARSGEPVEPPPPPPRPPTVGGFTPPSTGSGAPVPPPAYGAPQPPPYGAPVYPGQPQPTSTWGERPPGYAQPGPNFPPPGPARPTADGATAALVLGILGWVLCPVVCSIAAIVLGRQAKNEIDRNPGMYAGRDSAVAGFWLGVSSLVIIGGFFLAAILIGALSGPTD